MASAGALPGLVALALMPLALYLMYPPEIKSAPDAAAFAKDKIAELGSISTDEKIMLSVFALLLVLWAGIPAMVLGPGAALDPTSVAFIGLSLLLLTGVLHWQDVLKDKRRVGHGGVVQRLGEDGDLPEQAGLDSVVFRQPRKRHCGLGLNWLPAVALLVPIYLYAHSLFASTTATGTSPIIFGSGYTTLAQWWKTGFLMSLLLIAIWVMVGSLWWKLLGYWQAVGRRSCARCAGLRKP